jgi:hypothetical protein
MNKIVGKTADGGSFLALVLEPGNLVRFKEGRPIKFRVDELFPDGIPRRLELFIGFSETPIADARELRKQAEVTLDERTHVSQANRPHCPECKSTIEQLGALVNQGMPTVCFCPQCGCTLGVAGAGQMTAKMEGKGGEAKGGAGEI